VSVPRKGFEQIARPLIASSAILTHARQKAGMLTLASRDQYENGDGNGSPHRKFQTLGTSFSIFQRDGPAERLQGQTPMS
jgi:hypothetical protein